MTVFGVDVRMIITIVVLVMSFGAGWTVQGWRRDSADKERAEAAQELQRESRRGANTASAGHEKDRESIRTEFITIKETVEKIVEKPVYRNVCFDDDGMRALRAAVGTRPAASEPGATLPRSDDAR